MLLKLEGFGKTRFNPLFDCVEIYTKHLGAGGRLMNLKIVWKTIGTRLDSVLLDCGHRVEVVAYAWSSTTMISSFISHLFLVYYRFLAYVKWHPKTHRRLRRKLSTHASIRMNGRTHSL